LLNLFNDSSKEFKAILHNLLEEVVDFFIEIGSNLEYYEIYADVFPLHLQENEEYVLKILKKIQRYIKDNFNHDLSELENYVLHGILLYIEDATENSFELDSIIKKSLNQKSIFEKLAEDEIEVLHNISTPKDLTSISFEDHDFLDVNEFIEVFKEKPELLTDFFYVDLDEYTELMPEDIYLKYEKLKKERKSRETESSSQVIPSEVISSKSFKENIENMLKDFNHHVVHSELYKLINDPSGRVGEKNVQTLFKHHARTYLRQTKIVVSSEVDTGRGNVDFQLSEGNDNQVLIELKLDDHQNVEKGLHYQLPMYLHAENIDWGIYVLVCCSQKLYDKYEYLEKDSDSLSKEYQKDINFLRVDAIGNLKSASKIRDIKDMRL